MIVVMGPKKIGPNRYVLAVLTAVLAGLFSIVGNWYISNRHIDALILAERLVARRQAYQIFVETVGQRNSPELSQLLHLGSLADRVATDGEIQGLEDQFSEIIERLYSFDMYLQLSSDLGVVRLHGSEKVNRIADDLLATVALKYHDVDLDSYPPQFVSYWEHWKPIQKSDNVAYGWEPKVSPDERFTAIIASRLFSHLLETIREELRQNPR